MQITGHRTRAIFDRYNITSSDDKRAAMQLQAEYLKGKPTASNVSEFPSSVDSDSQNRDRKEVTVLILKGLEVESRAFESHLLRQLPAIFRLGN